jgi:poly-beta-1,6-N-acetyl-D-glucosamine biosynthesis protein PgaD
MDQPGSRLDASRHSLIIERPDLAHPLRRFFAVCFTALAWCAWIVLWLPVLAAIAERFHIAFPWPYRSGQHSLEALQGLLHVFPTAITIVIVVLAANGVISWAYRWVHKPQVHGHVGKRQLADSLSLDERKLVAWQAARILHVLHNPEGHVIDAKIMR